jgi:hypothetical protein
MDVPAPPPRHSGRMLSELPEPLSDSRRGVSQFRPLTGNFPVQGPNFLTVHKLFHSIGRSHLGNRVTLMAKYPLPVVSFIGGTKDCQRSNEIRVQNRSLINHSANQGCDLLSSFLKLRYFLVAFGTASIITGCAGVKFYSDADLTQRTGLKYYVAKPYLLVTRNGAKDTPLKVEVIQLPDLQNPNYAVYKPGWGTHEFALKVSNGILTEYNQKADSKGPETITALADLASKAGSGFSAAATGFQTLQKQAADVPAAIGAINLAVGNLQSASSALPDSSKVTKDAIDQAANSLKQIGDQLKAGNNDQKTALKTIEDTIGAIRIESAIPDADKIKGYLAGAKKQIQNAITALAEGNVRTPAEPVSTYELYEIQAHNGETSLVPVKVTESVLTTIRRYGRPHGK